MPGKGGASKAAADNRANQMNPKLDCEHAAIDNRANQLNPNNEAYAKSRG